jgi:hypothetical protein
MRVLGTALVVEGNSDALFLPTMITRVLQNLCDNHAPPEVGVSPVEVLPVDTSNGLVAGICGAARAWAESLQILFYHYDGSANPDRERRRYWDPLCAAWPTVAAGRELVAVVPVREMEAWALADQSALREVVGASVAVHQADRLADMERLEDPKRTLKELTLRGRGTRRHGRGPEEYLTLLAERVSFEELRTVPSFRRWYADTVEALRKMRYLP